MTLKRGARLPVAGSRSAGSDRLSGTIDPEPICTPQARQRLAEHLHSLGSRAVLEAMLELEAGRALDQVLRDYARLSPLIVRAVGADRMPPVPFTVVEGWAA